MKYSKKEISWMLYDCAGSAFSLIIITSVMPVFFKDVISAGLRDSDATSMWGFAQSLSMLIISIAAPFLGAAADSGKKKSMLVFFALVGSVGTVLIALAGRGDLALGLGLFIIAKTGFHAGNLIYDSFITDITERDRMDKVSAFGFASGYIGSVIPFAASIAIIFLMGGKIDEKSAAIVFLITGLWWIIFSIPSFIFLKQKNFQPARGMVFLLSVKRVFETLKTVSRQKNLFYFLGAYFLYIDGVSTIISMSSIYGRELGVSVNSLLILIFLIQVVAFPFTLLYGFFAGKFGTRNMILFGILIYMVITAVGFILPSMPQNLRTPMFWIMGFLVASSQGGIQALSRSYFAKMIPEGRSAEMFGFYNIFGKFAAVVGPALLGTMAYFSGGTRWGILSLMVLFFLGAVVLKYLVREEEKAG